MTGSDKDVMKCELYYFLRDSVQLQFLQGLFASQLLN